MSLRLTTYQVNIDAVCDDCGTRLWTHARLEAVAPGVAIFRADAALSCRCGPMQLTGAISVDPNRPAFRVEMPLTISPCGAFVAYRFGTERTCDLPAGHDGEHHEGPPPLERRT